jgi:hypothetical protein
MVPDIDDDSVLFLAKEKWDLRGFIVFDMFNDGYDPDKAHLEEQNNLSVISVFQNERVSVAGKPLAEKVNKDIRDLHNSTGLGSRPPFSADHADG